MMKGTDDLQQNKDRTRERERAEKVRPVLHSADEEAHGDCEDGRQQTAEDERRPPRAGQREIGLWQDAKKFPFVALAKAREHGTLDTYGFARPGDLIPAVC